MLLSDKQIQELIDIVDLHNSIFIGNHFGQDALTHQEKHILTRRGIDWRKYEDNYVDFSYKFGKIAEALKGEKSLLDKMTFKELRKFVKSGKFVPLSKTEQFVLNVVKTQTYKDVRKLKNKIVDDIYQISINLSDKKKYTKFMQESAVDAISDRLSVVEFSSMLSEKTQDWSRDFDRIADYIMHSAYQHGKANELLRTGDKMIWFRVQKGACKHCNRLYIKNKKTKEPKIFLLSKVLSNGSNIGRKVNDYRPSIYPVHPWCRCELEQYNKETKWDGKKFVLRRNKYGIKRKSRVKIKKY